MFRRSLSQAAAVCLAALLAAACSDRATAPPVELGANLSASRLSAAPSSVGWQEQARALIAANNLSPLAAGRVLAALSVAQYRAVVDADGKQEIEGQLPANGLGAGGRSLLEARRGAVAGASARVLTFFFPAAAASLEQRLQTEGETGPGNVHPQFTRGVTIGRVAGTALVQRAMGDGFTTPWTGTVPTGPGMWIASGPPAGATFGGVTPYLLASGSQFRSPPPPAFNSAAFNIDRDEIKTLSVNRTPAQQATAVTWNYPTGTFTPVGFWNSTAASYIQGSTLDERAAAHTFALVHAAVMDALIGCWDTKYFYWMLRPTQADPTITLSFALPNHPSYPSGHSCVSASAATVLAHVFPDKAGEVTGLVAEAGLSRMYAGIHYRFDVTAGKNLGVAVAQWAIGKDESEGLLAAMR